MDATEDQWLILSLVYSRRSDFLVWWRPKGCGYTTDINKAGRFTEEDAKGANMKDLNKAVRLSDAMKLTEARIVASSDNLRTLEQQ